MDAILSLHALVNLANLANGAMSRFIGEPGERSEPQFCLGLLVNLANLVKANLFIVLDINVLIMLMVTVNIVITFVNLLIINEMLCKLYV